MSVVESYVIFRGLNNGFCIINYSFSWELASMEEKKSKGRFLDVSEYMLKEFSPLHGPMSGEFRQPERVSLGIDYEFEDLGPALGVEFIRC